MSKENLDFNDELMSRPVRFDEYGEVIECVSDDSDLEWDDEHE
jgi:hypothetical protein